MFQYLGCVEVFESRGMQVCEEAVRVLKVSTTWSEKLTPNIPEMRWLKASYETWNRTTRPSFFLLAFVPWPYQAKLWQIFFPHIMANPLHSKFWAKVGTNDERNLVGGIDWLMFETLWGFSLSEFQKEVRPSHFVRAWGWVESRGRGDQRFDCGSNNWKGLILCPGSKLWARLLLHLSRWNHSTMDVSRFHGNPRIGKNHHQSTSNTIIEVR